MSRTVVDALAGAFARDGVRHVFGVPGGGSSLDLIRACGERGIDFVLTRTETAAVIMAAVTAELTGSLGVALTTRGPGTASAANGVAYASLDRAAVLVITDGWSPAVAGYDTHQVFDQPAMLGPVVKGHSRLDGDDVDVEAGRLIELAKSAPPGPVHIELTGEAARREIRPMSGDGEPASRPSPDPQPVDALRRRIAAARRPVIVVGLEARPRHVAGRVRRFADELACPVFTTYKARGIVPDEAPGWVGNFTGGAVERDCVSEADLIVLVGLDPVELIGQPWPYSAPVAEISLRRHPVHYVEPAVAVHQPLEATLDALSGRLGASDWSESEIARHRDDIRARLAHAGEGTGLTPDAVVDTAHDVAGASRPRIAVDAGAHMFSAMARWPCADPDDALISNGLSTMAFALPAALASSIAEPDRPVIAFTGDGGLMMCAGELSTAAQYGGRLVIVVFNDAGLSLIGIKQQARQLPRAGVEWPRPDFARVADGFGLRGFRAETLEDYRAALAGALDSGRPALIDVRVDPSGYPAQSRALRG